MANLTTLECTLPACTAGNSGARYKTPPLPPDVAVQLLALHDRRVHGAAVDQGRHQGGTGGADVHPPDTAAWPVCDDSEPKTTGQNSNTMVTIETVLECPIPGCKGGENFDVFVTPSVSTERAVDILRLHCKREHHTKQCVPQPYLVVDSSELGEKTVLEKEWLEFLRGWAVYRASVKGTREKLHYLMLDSLLDMSEIVN